MGEKFLSKEGLSRFFEKMKTKFAPIDSPSFIGTPTVTTPEYAIPSVGKEVVNREYVSRAYRELSDAIEQKLKPIIMRFSISPKQWEVGENAYYCDRIKNLIQLDSGFQYYEAVLSLIQLDYELCEPELRGLEFQYRLEIDSMQRIYFIGDMPKVDIPVIVTLSRVTDCSLLLVGGR